MAELGPGPHRSGDIASGLGVKVESGLIVKGMIYSPAHGDTASTVPLFDELPPTRDARLGTGMATDALCADIGVPSAAGH